jgi:hypothetical protein
MTNRAPIFSALLVYILLTLTTGAKAQSPPSLYTGSDWNTTPEALHSFFVIGYAHGFSRGIRLAASLKSINGNGNTAMERLYFRNRSRGNDKQQQFDKIEHEMTLFYNDFRNTPVCWGDAELISILTLSGAAPSDAELDAVRSEDAKEGCPN